MRIEGARPDPDQHFARLGHRRVLLAQLEIGNAAGCFQPDDFHRSPRPATASDPPRTSLPGIAPVASTIFEGDRSIDDRGAIAFGLLNQAVFDSPDRFDFGHNLPCLIADTSQTLATRDSFGPTVARLMSTHLLAG